MHHVRRLLRTDASGVRSNMYVCGGDCDGNGIVDTSEILRMASIFGQATPLDTCPAGDINGDGIITTNEILAAVFNFGAGCPAH